MNITHQIRLDLTNRGVMPRIDAVQGDCNSRTAELALTVGGESWTVPEGVRGAVRYHKPDGTAGRYDRLPDGTQAVTAAGSCLTVRLAPQMLTVPGAVVAQVTLAKQETVVATFSFQINVEEDPARGTLQSEDYVNQLRVFSVNGHSGDVTLKAKDVGAAEDIGRGTFSGNINVVDNRDNVHENSVVWVGPTIGTQNMPRSFHGLLSTWSAGSKLFQQITFTDGSICRRMYFDPGTGGAWKDWEWTACPGNPGAEYRTAEQYDGRTVFTKLFKITGCKNGTTLTTNIANVIRYGATYGGLPLPYGDQSQSTAVRVDVNTNKAVFHVKGLSAATAWLQLWYYL